MAILLKIFAHLPIIYIRVQYAPKKTAASAVNRTNTDRVEFGFERAIAAAKAEIAAAAKADASPKELLEAQQTAEQGVDSSSIADLILMG